MNNAQAERWVDRRSKRNVGSVKKVKDSKFVDDGRYDAPPQRPSSFAANAVEGARLLMGDSAAHRRLMARMSEQQRVRSARTAPEDGLGLNPNTIAEWQRLQSARSQAPDSFGMNHFLIGKFDPNMNQVWQQMDQDRFNQFGHFGTPSATRYAFGANRPSMYDTWGPDDQAWWNQ